MTTEDRLRRLCGWSVQGAIGALLLVFCASSFGADAGKNVVTTSKKASASTQRKIGKKMCSVYIFGSKCPQPCDRLGPIPTTATPMQIIGNYNTYLDTERGAKRDTR